jgi:hypothetical protein
MLALKFATLAMGNSISDVANKNSVVIATLANEIFTVLEKIYVKFQTSNVYLKNRSAAKM